MTDSFYHGIELVEIESGTDPITTIKTSVVGLLGTAPDADADKFPLDTPVLLTHPRDIAGIGATGTLAAACEDIYSIANPWIVMIRVAEGADATETSANIVGGVDLVTGVRTGSHALLDARDTLRVVPRLLIAPGFTQDKSVADALVSRAEKLKSMVIADGPNTTDAAAVTYRGQFDSPRLYLVDPWVRVQTSTGEVVRPASARIAAMIALSDNTRGFWHSPSNLVMPGILGAARPIVYAHNDPDTQSNYLNGEHITTIIHQDGYRLWGNRTTATDPRWRYFSVRRIADMINESLIEAHFKAVDKNITRTYFDDVVESVNAYIRRLKKLEAVINGRCWADKELNSVEAIMDGRAYFDFDFSVPYPAERVQFRSHMVGDYLEEVF